jgi:hypothetical protein
MTNREIANELVRIARMVLAMPNRSNGGFTFGFASGGTSTKS